MSKLFDEVQSSIERQKLDSILKRKLCDTAGMCKRQNYAVTVDQTSLRIQQTLGRAPDLIYCGRWFDNIVYILQQKEFNINPGSLMHAGLCVSALWAAAVPGTFTEAYLLLEASSARMWSRYRNSMASYAMRRLQQFIEQPAGQLPMNDILKAYNTMHDCKECAIVLLVRKVRWDVS